MRNAPSEYQILVIQLVTIQTDYNYIKKRLFFFSKCLSHIKNRDFFFFSELFVLFFSGDDWFCNSTGPYPSAVHHLPVPTLRDLFDVACAIHSCLCALLSASVPLQIWALNSYLSILFTEMTVESLCGCSLMGGQRVNTRCMFWVVRGWGETASLISGCLQGQAECARGHLGDSPDSRLSWVQRAQLNIGRMMGSQWIHSFYERE